MKIRKEESVVTYETGHEDFLVDAVDKYDMTDNGKEHIYEAWIYRESEDTKKMIYGELAGAYRTFEEFCADLEEDDFDVFYRRYDREVR